MLGFGTKKALRTKAKDVLKESNLLKLDCVSSDVGMMIDNFLKGEKILSSKLENYKNKDIPFDFRLCEKLFLQIVPSKLFTYEEGIKHIKRVLNDCTVEYTTDAVFFNPTKGYKLTEEDKVLLVRYVNMCIGHKQYIIVYRNNIIFIPDQLKVLSQETIVFHVSKAKKDIPGIKKRFWQ